MKRRAAEEAIRSLFETIICFIRLSLRHVREMIWRRGVRSAICCGQRLSVGLAASSDLSCLASFGSYFFNHPGRKPALYPVPIARSYHAIERDGEAWLPIDCLCDDTRRLQEGLSEARGERFPYYRDHSLRLPSRLHILSCSNKESSSRSLIHLMRPSTGESLEQPCRRLFVVHF